MTRALAESRAMKAQMLAENLASLDGDYATQMLVDDTIEYLSETREHYTEVANAPHGFSDALLIIGILAALIAGSGIDVPDNNVNVAVCLIGCVVAVVGILLRKRD